ncbi:MAG: hydrogenase maturation protease [Ignavibacteria bacterium]|nr:hydrogenase maturation protease [Ignavibacteria bacterium]
MSPSSPVKKADATSGWADQPGIVVIGVGNELRGDDALGPIIVRMLKEHPVSGVAYLEQSGEGASLIELWRGHSAAIIVDAFSSGSAPGIVHVLNASITEIPQHLFTSSSHTFGVAQAIELSRRLDLLPRTTILCGIEGKSFVAGEMLSHPVRQQLTELLEIVERTLHELLIEQHLHHLSDPL